MSICMASNDAIGENSTNSSNKCSWCDRKRARNDLCNVCRQKVESRARRLMEQKIGGDMDCIQTTIMYFKDQIPLNSLNSTDLITLIAESFPFLMLKFQSEKTYRGKKGNRCWCLPDSVLKKVMTSFFPTDATSSAIIKTGGRQELCQLLMDTVTKSFSKHIKDAVYAHTTNTGNTPRLLKRKTMEDEHDRNHNAPPIKRQRTERRDDLHANGDVDNENLIQDHRQIWGRSDTELLSFDINQLGLFLHKFEQQVLNGDELERVEAHQRLDFLKKRCKEFVKILNELRDYVLHLRTNLDTGATQNDNKDVLLRCTTNLFRRLSVDPSVYIELGKNEVPQLEQYHNMGCNELYETVRCIESIGSQIGYPRAPSTSLKQYTAHMELSILRNNTRKEQQANRRNVEYLQNQNIYTVHTESATNDINNTHNVHTLYSNNAFHSSPPQRTQPMNIYQPHVQQTQNIQRPSVIIAPIASSYALVTNNNNNSLTVAPSTNTQRLPLNTNALDTLGITVPIISSNINQGQLLPTTFNFAI